MALTVEELATLYILQKDYHNEVPGAEKAFQEAFVKILKEYKVKVDERFAPSQHGDIPFIFYRPAIAKIHNKRPLLIHTHGGPHVYMHQNTLHAEIAYYLSHGYSVACPNYRGSTGYPGYRMNTIPEDWAKSNAWVEGKYHQTGPMDVMAVARKVSKYCFVDKTKIILRGLSFGSFINSHLLTQIKAGVYENLFCGVHLGGGVRYPAATAMPDKFPIYIAHGVNDNVAKFDVAAIFMQNLLLKEARTNAENPVVQVHVSRFGGHHMIAEELDQHDIAKNSPAYQEMLNYLTQSTQFVHQLFEKDCYCAEPPLQQLTTLLAESESKIEIENKIDNLVKVDGYLAQSVGEFKEDGVAEEEVKVEQESLPCPSMAHLSHNLMNSQLEVSNTPREDLSTFLKECYKPRDWDDGHTPLVNEGNEMLADQEFMDQMVGVLEHEQSYLAKRPGTMVLYHAAEFQALQLYTFINLWKNLLKGDFTPGLSVINEMRFFDFMSTSFDDVNAFLSKMREQRVKESEQELKDNNDSLNKYFNYVDGFSERALSCNPSLVHNQYSTSSCTLHWYYRSTLATKTSNKVPIGQVLDQALNAMGLFQPARKARYLQFFQFAKASIEFEADTQPHGEDKQGLLQQIFIPYELADRLAYVCLLWGEELKWKSEKKTGRLQSRLEAMRSLDLRLPSSLQMMHKDPSFFELNLSLQHNAFNNHGSIPDYLNHELKGGFSYSNLLQLRYLHRPDYRIKTFSYFRNPKLFEQFALGLQQLVKEDYADFLVIGYRIPRGVSLVIADRHQELRVKLGLPPAQQISTEVLLMEQEALHKGLVQNPSDDHYSDILSVTTQVKGELQKYLNKALFFSPQRPGLYMLCRYLKGYTYYDLLLEAAKAMLPSSNDGHSGYEYFEMLFKRVSMPSTLQAESLSEDESHFIFSQIETLKNYQYNSQTHKMIRSYGTEGQDGELFKLDFNSAMESFEAVISRMAAKNKIVVLPG